MSALTKLRPQVEKIQEDVLNTANVDFADYPLLREKMREIASELNWILEVIQYDEQNPIEDEDEY